MVFDCFRDSKCEWHKGLCDFAEKFNKEYEKNYELFECPDVKDHSRPRPEALLKADGEPSMVIECKKIVCPPEYYKNHDKWHKFFDLFSRSFNEHIKSLIPESSYNLQITDSIYNFKIPEIRETANSITDSIRDSLSSSSRNQILEKLTNHYSIGCQQPIPWSFRQLADFEREEDGNRINLQVTIKQGMPSLHDHQAAGRYVLAEIPKYLERASKKFEGYESCIKILVFELCGDMYLLPLSDKFQEMCEKTSLPQLVNQIWLAESTFDGKADYFRMR